MDRGRANGREEKWKRSRERQREKEKEGEEVEKLTFLCNGITPHETDFC